MDADCYRTRTAHDSGLGLLLRRNGSQEKRHFNHAAELYQYGSNHLPVGRRRIQHGIWRLFGWNRRQSTQSPLFHQRFWARTLSIGPKHSLCPFRPFSAQVCHYHSSANHRGICGARALSVLPPLYRLVHLGDLHSVSPHDVAPRRPALSVGRA